MALDRGRRFCSVLRRSQRRTDSAVLFLRRKQALHIPWLGPKLSEPSPRRSSRPSRQLCSKVYPWRHVAIVSREALQVATHDICAAPVTRQRNRLLGSLPRGESTSSNAPSRPKLLGSRPISHWIEQNHPGPSGALKIALLEIAIEPDFPHEPHLKPKSITCTYPKGPFPDFQMARPWDSLADHLASEARRAARFGASRPCRSAEPLWHQSVHSTPQTLLPFTFKVSARPIMLIAYPPAPALLRQIEQ